MDDNGIYGEQDLDIYDDEQFQKPTGNRNREGDFTAKPDEGWLHDDRALGAGRGIFYKFDVRWIGSVVLGASIRHFGIQDQTELLRKIIAHVDEPEIHRGNIQLGSQSYMLGKLQQANVNVMLSVSSSGIMVAPPGFEGGDNDRIGIISFSPMRLISLAAGGENEFYNYFVFVGKDPTTQIREAFVFNCGAAADEILSTLGQAFILFQQESEAKKGGKRAVLDEAFGMSASHEAIYDTAAGNEFLSEEKVEQLYDVASNPEIAALVKNTDGDVDDIAEELMNLMKSEAKLVYDTTENIDSSKLLSKFNNREGSTKGEWVKFETPKDMSYASLEELQALQAKQSR
eukprot:m.94117 g.94117  ORF g.94117 m.94117 type:complete len:344 (+) comp26685_c0_seq1:107-1138(+)